MTEYSHARTLRTSRNVFVIARYAFFLGVVTLCSLSVQTRDQHQPQAEEPQVKVQNIPASRSTDIFLSLAETVGQGIPAKRLVESKLRIDASGSSRYWAIVDFNQPSTNKRFYLFDTVKNQIETFYVAHGRGSEGAVDDGVADVFSNESSSHSSSLGIYRALDEYVGNHGRSMRLQGLEPTNSNAFDRAVVLHRADYATEGFIRSTGRLGRSEGCFAVDPAVEDALVDKLKNGAYIIAWKTQR